MKHAERVKHQGRGETDSSRELADLRKELKNEAQARQRLEQQNGTLQDMLRQVIMNLVALLVQTYVALLTVSSSDF